MTIQGHGMEDLSWKAAVCRMTSPNLEEKNHWKPRRMCKSAGKGERREIKVRDSKGTHISYATK